MGKIFQRRTLSGWIPADEDAQAVWRKQKLGEVYGADVAKPRHYKHHCLFICLLEMTFENQSRYDNDRDFRRAVADAAGWVEEYVKLDGEIVRHAKPYDYEHLPDEDDFTLEFGKAMAVCASILGHTCPELEGEVARYANEKFYIECPRIFREDVKERAA